MIKLLHLSLFTVTVILLLTMGMGVGRGAGYNQVQLTNEQLTQFLLAELILIYIFYELLQYSHV